MFSAALWAKRATACKNRLLFFILVSLLKRAKNDEDRFTRQTFICVKVNICVRFFLDYCFKLCHNINNLKYCV